MKKLKFYLKHYQDAIGVYAVVVLMATFEYGYFNLRAGVIAFVMLSMFWIFIWLIMGKNGRNHDRELKLIRMKEQGLITQQKLDVFYSKIREKF